MEFLLVEKPVEIKQGIASFIFSAFIPFHPFFSARHSFLWSSLSPLKL
jgi:hypothetical protein